MTYSTFKTEKNNIRKTNLKFSQILLNKLQLCQQTLGFGYIGENQYIVAIQRVCCRVSKLEFVLFTPITTIEKFSHKLQSSIMTYDNRNAANI